MAQLFEYCFYLGVVLALLGLGWLVANIFRGQARKWMTPIVVLLLGGALILGPAVLSRTMAVDLGPRDKIVNNERHISLTGWDGESYAFLSDTPDAVVLQMGNADVTDSTLDALSNMTKLRELDLNDSSITDAGLAKLSALPSLRTLRLRGAKITDAGFRQHLLNSQSLQQLDLRQTAVSVEAVEEWKSLTEGRRAFQ